MDAVIDLLLFINASLGEIMKKLDGKELLDEIKNEVKQDKKEIKNMKKELKEPKLYSTNQIIKAIVIVFTLLSLGAFIGITINNSINNMINTRVQSEVKAQVEVFTKAVQDK